MSSWRSMLDLILRPICRLGILSFVCLALLFANGPHLRTQPSQAPVWLAQYGLSGADICGLGPVKSDGGSHHTDTSCSLCNALAGGVFDAVPNGLYLFSQHQARLVLPAPRHPIARAAMGASHPIRAPPALFV